MKPFSPSIEINGSTSLIFPSLPIPSPLIHSMVHLSQTALSPGQLLPFQQQGLQSLFPFLLLSLFDPFEAAPSYLSSASFRESFECSPPGPSRDRLLPSHFLERRKRTSLPSGLPPLFPNASARSSLPLLLIKGLQMLQPSFSGRDFQIPPESLLRRSLGIRWDC